MLHPLPTLGSTLQPIGGVTHAYPSCTFTPHVPLWDTTHHVGFLTHHTHHTCNLYLQIPIPPACV